MTDWTKWKMVPVEATAEMLSAAFNAPTTGHPETGGITFVDSYAAMLAAAPAPPVVEVTRCQAFGCYVQFNGAIEVSTAPIEQGRAMIAAVQSTLGPTLGLVTREELARAVEAAFADGNRLYWRDGRYVVGNWNDSESRKRLEGGR